MLDTCLFDIDSRQVATNYCFSGDRRRIAFSITNEVTYHETCFPCLSGRGYISRTHELEIDGTNHVVSLADHL